MGKRGTSKPTSRTRRKDAVRRTAAKTVAKPSDAPPQPAPILTGAQRKRLRGLAHHLLPLVHVGHEGISDAVVAATRSALYDHELVKVRLHEPEDKRAMAPDLATRTLAALCGMVGHTVILYKPHPKRPSIEL